VPTAPQRRKPSPRLGRGALRLTALVLAAALTSCGPQESAPAGALGDGWHEFSGSWSAAGRRTSMPLGPQRRVAVLDLSGSLLLSGPTRPALGFQSHFLGLSDELTGMVGRAVWTDERGEQVFSELQGARDGAAVRIEGRFVGGTGRWAGATGEYAFQWQYLLEGEDGQVQGRAQGLAGRVQVPAAGAAAPR